MKTTLLGPLFAVSAVTFSCLLLGSPGLAQGQSSARGNQTGGQGKLEAQAGLGGYCPMTILEKKQWVKGTPQFQFTYEGTKYHFANQSLRDRFAAQPEAFSPSLEGDCAVTKAETGQRKPGSLQHAAFYKKRLYLFATYEHQQKFLRQPSVFANVAATESQIAWGAKVYVSRCASCHGNSGEGVEDYPAVVGKGVFGQFSTALDIAVFATQKMPPKESVRKQMAERDYWSVLAFALTANGVKLREPVSADNAGAIVLHPK